MWVGQNSPILELPVQRWSPAMLCAWRYNQCPPMQRSQGKKTLAYQYCYPWCVPSNMSTPDDLRHATISCLQSWQSSAPLTNDPSWPPTLFSVITNQDNIGWKALLEGLPSKYWKSHIVADIFEQKINKSPQAWISEFLHAILTLAWTQWEHWNTILHQIDQPMQQKAEQLLNSLIVT